MSEEKEDESNQSRSEMSEIALDAICDASARSKDEQFLSMLKNSVTCSALQCGVFDKLCDAEKIKILDDALKGEQIPLEDALNEIRMPKSKLYAMPKDYYELFNENYEFE